MNLTEARGIAELLLAEMAPYCEQAHIAGSIRREKAEVKDIEIVCVPRWEQTGWADLYETEPVMTSALHEWAIDQARLSVGLQWIKPGVSEILPWDPKPQGKYWRGLLHDEIKLDLFLARPENFGAIYLIRTGSAEFSQAIVTHAKAIGRPCVDGFLTLNGKAVETRTEREVFEFLGLEWVEAPLRTGPEALRRRGR